MHPPAGFPFSVRLHGVAFAALLSCVGGRVHAHPEIEAALERLNPQIEASPADPALYLERGQLYAKHLDFISAEANYLRAAELAPALPRLDCARASLALAAGNPREAREHLDRALALDPRDAEAWILRSRVRRALDDRSGALNDLERSLTLLPHPRPELFLERAALLPSTSDAIRSLDEAVRRIGPAHTLQLRALELEESSGNTEAALTRIDQIAARSERKETWLRRRGDVLARAGRTAEAREAYAAALAAIAALPDWLRESPDTVQLIAELTSLASVSS